MTFGVLVSQFEMTSPSRLQPSKAEEVVEVERDDDNLLEPVVEQQPAYHQATNNPMLMQEILEKLFEYLEFADLSRTRRVSKLWFQESLQHWLRKGPMLCLPFDLDLDATYYHPCGVVDKTIMSGFLEVVHNEFHSYAAHEYAGLRQYRKFEIKGEADLLIHRQLLQNFLRHCGDWVTELKLELTFPDVETYRAVMLSRMTPNLAKLAVVIKFLDAGDEKGCKYKLEEQVHSKLKSLEIVFKGEDREGLPVAGWIQLLQRYPNLKTLVLGKEQVRPANIRDANRMLEALWTVRRQAAEWKLLDLRHLDISIPVFNTISGSELREETTWMLRVLRDSGLTLETLRISFVRRTPNQTIYEVLESQSATLKNLSICKMYKLAAESIPIMSSVEKLEVVGPIKDLGFLKAFPSLKSFTVSSSYFPRPLHYILRDTTDEKLEGLVIPSLASLESVQDVVEENIGPEDIRKLKRVMPNLKRLGLRLNNNESFRAVCECWPQLEHLHIVGFGVDDEGITGIVDAGNANGPNIIPHNITSFKCLKSFKMKRSASSSNPRNKDHGIMEPVLTEKSAAEFLKLPNLEELEIWIVMGVDIDMSVIKAMKAKIKKCMINLATPTTKTKEENQDRDSGDDSGGGGGGDGESESSEGRSDSD